MNAVYVKALVGTIFWYVVGSWLGSTWNVLEWSGFGIAIYLIWVGNIWLNAVEIAQETDDD